MPACCTERCGGRGRTAPGVVSAAATQPARGDTTDRAELHGLLHRSTQGSAGVVASELTLVTLDCTSVDIAMSVTVAAGGVYSPPVLHPWARASPSCGSVAMPSSDRATASARRVSS